MKYRYEATSVAGFLAQLVNYVTHGFVFYVVGIVPDDIDPKKTDESIVRNYDLFKSVREKARRKAAGFAGVHYLRYGRFYVLLATRGLGRFFEREKKIQDIREDGLHCFSYSVSLRPDTVKAREGKKALRGSVRIHREEFLNLKAFLLEIALRRRKEDLEAFFWSLPYEPYAPVRAQMFTLLRAVNRARKRGGLSELEWACSIRLRRRPVSAFVLRDELQVAASMGVGEGGGQP